mgnify:CR=1 FL=1
MKRRTSRQSNVKPTQREDAVVLKWGGRLVPRIQKARDQLEIWALLRKKEIGTKSELPAYLMMDLQDEGSEPLAAVPRKHRA